MTLLPLSPEPSGFANPCFEIALSNFESCKDIYEQLKRANRMYTNIIEQTVTDGRGYDANSNLTNDKYVGLHNKLLNMDYRDGKIDYSKFMEESLNLLLVNNKHITDVDTLNSEIFQVKMNELRKRHYGPGIFFSESMYYSVYDLIAEPEYSLSYSRPER